MEYEKLNFSKFLEDIFVSVLINVCAVMKNFEEFLKNLSVCIF